MPHFTMTVAGYTGQITGLFDSTPHHFHSYLTENPPDFSYTVTAQDLAFEQAELLAEAQRDGFRPRVFTDPFLERAAILRAFADFLFDRQILLLHGSAIAVDGTGYLFTAPSGTGKSTHTRLWREAFGARTIMINDDRPFIELGETNAWLHGSPWSGKHGLHTNLRVPLGGICLLERGQENRISPLSPETGLDRLLPHIYVPLSKAHARIPAELLCRSTPLWQMACNKNPDAAHTAFAAMGRISP